MSLISELKNKIKKHIRKYMTVVSSLLLLPLFSINSYAAYSTYPQYDMTIRSTSSFQKWEGSIRAVATMSKGDDSNYHFTGEQGWVNNAEIFIPTYLSNSSESDDKFYFPINTELFDYYLIATLSTDLSPAVYDGSQFSVGDWDVGNITDWASGTFVSSGLLTDKKQYYSLYDYDDSANGGVQLITFSAKLNLDYIGDFNVGCFHFTDINYCHYNSTKMFSCSVIVSNKGDTDAYNDIVTAINNQTDIIENGNSGTQSTITDFNEVFDDFNTELENIEKFDTEIIDEFESANETYLTELNNFSLSASLLNAGNWLSTSMQTVYDNSSDYKMLWLVPLLLGIPLLILFVRKGDNNE